MYSNWFPARKAIANKVRLGLQKIILKVDIKGNNMNVLEDIENPIISFRKVKRKQKKVYGKFNRKLIEREKVQMLMLYILDIFE